MITRADVVDKVPVTLLGLAIVANLVNDRTGHGTICSTTRPLWGVIEDETGNRRISRRGRRAVALGLAGFAGWFFPHYVNGPIR